MIEAYQTAVWSLNMLVNQIEAAVLAKQKGGK